jgi:glutamate/tyrosine decarboxylase-like PLP-dependent enzyme
MVDTNINWHSELDDPEAFRAFAHEAVDVAADYLAALPERPVFQQMSPESRVNLLEAPLPTSGMSAGTVLDQFRSEIMPYPMGNGHPRFFGWVNSPPTAIGIVAELLAATMNPSCAGGDHAAIYLERVTVRWLMELMGFPAEGSMGILVSGGSMASLTGLATARQWASAGDGWNARREGAQGGAQVTMYVSSETHTTVIKAAELLGIGSQYVRIIAADADFRMDAVALEAAVIADRNAGYRPFAVVGSAGTVSTGSIDPLDAIADLCAEHGIWFHIDAAYGGPGILDGRVAPLYSGMERADSLAIDPHKWLSVPVECGCVFVRDGTLLRQTFSLVPPYVQVEEGKGFGGLPWYAEYGFQQSRGFRALKTWMSLAHAGREGIEQTIRRHNDLARYLAGRIESYPCLELVVAPQLSIVCFRYLPSSTGTGVLDANALNKTLMERVQASGEAFVTQAVLGDVFALRANVLHFSSTETDLDALVDVVVRNGDRLVAERAGSGAAP